MHITLTGTPPSTSQIYKYRAVGNFVSGYMTKEGKDKKEDYGWEMLNQWHRVKLLKEPFSLNVDYYFQDKRRRDIDNFSKLWMDAGTGIIWEDDSLIEKLTLRKFIDKQNPRIEIEILPIDIITKV